jgi:hypothetical protein
MNIKQKGSKLDKKRNDHKNCLISNRKKYRINELKLLIKIVRLLQGVTKVIEMES